MVAARDVRQGGPGIKDVGGVKTPPATEPDAAVSRFYPCPGASCTATGSENSEVLPPGPDVAVAVSTIPGGQLPDPNENDLSPFAFVVTF